MLDPNAALARWFYQTLTRMHHTTTAGPRLLMCSFAGIATWRFGSYRDEFGSLSESLQTQFLMLFGEFPVRFPSRRKKT